MSTARLYRLAGLALLIGGVVSVIGYGVGTFQSDDSPTMVASAPYLAMSLLNFIGAALIALGMPGMIARQADKAGILSVIGGVALMLVELIFGIGNEYVNLTIVPTLAAMPGADITTPPPMMGVFFNTGIVLVFLGSLTLGIATLRARVFPRWIGVVLLLGILAEVASAFDLPYVSNLAPILLSVALLGVGWILVTTRPVSATSETARAVVATVA